MRKIFFLVALVVVAGNAYAGQSVILDTEGYACMGDDKSRKQTEQQAIQDCKRKATESATSYIKSETQVKDAILEKDLVAVYANAHVNVVQELAKEWYKDREMGECFKVRMKVEVAPDEKSITAAAEKSHQVLEDDPAAPLSVKVWTDRPSYAEDEPVRIFIKGNKPFYGRVIYTQADGSQVQLLPNPDRRLNFFNGGMVYQLPSGEDRFSIQTSPPFGVEKVTVYASTAVLGEIDVAPADSVYQVHSSAEKLRQSTRGVKLVTGDTKRRPVAEFAEAAAEVTTKKR